MARPAQAAVLAVLGDLVHLRRRPDRLGQLHRAGGRAAARRRARWRAREADVLAARGAASPCWRSACLRAAATVGSDALARRRRHATGYVAATRSSGSPRRTATAPLDRERYDAGRRGAQHGVVPGQGRRPQLLGLVVRALRRGDPGPEGRLGPAEGQGRAVPRPGRRRRVRRPARRSWRPTG